MRSTTKAVRRALDAWPGTMRGLAREAGVPLSTLSRVGSGERDATVDVAAAVAGACTSAADALTAAAKALEAACKEETP